MKEKQRRLSHEEKTELFEMFKTGKYSGNQLTNYFPISQVAINSLLRRNGYVAKSASELKRKYPINENLKLSDRVWTCDSCKVVNSRDFNAACRIEEEGRRLARLLM